MAMQTKVGLYPVTGFPGQEVNPGSAIYTAENYISDGTLTAGAFAFTSAVTGTGTAAAFKAAGKTGTAVTGTGTAAAFKAAGKTGTAVTGTGTAAAFKAAGKTGTALIGFVERTVTGAILSPLNEAEGAYAQGTGASIALHGQFYASASGAVTEGQSVLVNPATGAVTYGNAGSDNDTGWIVHLPNGLATAAEGDIVIYERV